MAFKGRSGIRAGNGHLPGINVIDQFNLICSASGVENDISGIGIQEFNRFHSRVVDGHTIESDTSGVRSSRFKYNRAICSALDDNAVETGRAALDHTAETSCFMKNKRIFIICGARQILYFSKIYPGDITGISTRNVPDDVFARSHQGVINALPSDQALDAAEVDQQVVSGKYGAGTFGATIQGPGTRQVRPNQRV